MTQHPTLTALSIAILFAVGLTSGQPSLVGAQTATLDATVQCLESASHRTELLTVQRGRLCMATPTPLGPVDCFVDARSLLLTDEQSITLCRCSPDDAPIACYRTMRDAGLLIQSDIVAMCSPSLTQRLGPNCR